MVHLEALAPGMPAVVGQVTAAAAAAVMHAVARDISAPPRPRRPRPPRPGELSRPPRPRPPCCCTGRAAPRQSVSRPRRPRPPDAHHPRSPPLLCVEAARAEAHSARRNDAAGGDADVAGPPMHLKLAAWCGPTCTGCIATSGTWRTARPWGTRDGRRADSAAQLHPGGGTARTHE
eukprot:355627-Chlamydomonas_euryale.AAC.16